MEAMLLPGMKGSPLLVQRTVTRTFELQESISKDICIDTKLNLPYANVLQSDVPTKSFCVNLTIEVNLAGNDVQ
ncbi:hypothetical protein STEG23_011704, partial [Scotinomys teguina]